MKVLLVSATDLELQGVRSILTEVPLPEILITGVGGVATSYALTQHLAHHKYDILIQAGVAGSFSQTWPLGSVVTVASECFGDLGVEETEGYQSVFDLSLAQPNHPPFSGGWLPNPHLKNWDRLPFPALKSVTVNTITTAPHRMAYLKNQMGAQIESMEGAAFHYVALMEKLPFLQIRALSNFVGERDKNHWELPLAIDNLQQAIGKILSIGTFAPETIHPQTRR